MSFGRSVGRLTTATLRDEMGVSEQFPLAASGQMPLAAHIGEGVALGTLLRPSASRR